MTNLHLSLALLALLSMPIALQLLSKAPGFQAQVGVRATARVVGMTILVADTVGPPLSKFGEVVLLILILFAVGINDGLRLKPGLAMTIAAF